MLCSFLFYILNTFSGVLYVYGSSYSSCLIKLSSSISSKVKLKESSFYSVVIFVNGIFFVEIS